MVTDITSYDPLLSCTAYDKEILLKKITIENWIKIPESDFIEFEGSILRRKNQIESVRNASSIEYFEMYILPGLSREYVEEYESIKGVCPKDIELSRILDKLKEKHKQRKYEEEMNRPCTPEELEQRRKIVALYKAKFLNRE